MGNKRNTIVSIHHRIDPSDEFGIERIGEFAEHETDSL